MNVFYGERDPVREVLVEPSILARSSLFEDGIELNKQVGNLRLKYLKSLYDGHTIAKRYCAGEAVLHLHFLGHQGQGAKEDKISLKWCVFIRKRRKMESVTTLAGNPDHLPMLVAVGEVAKPTRPVASIVRLQPLNLCDVFVADAFEVGLAPKPEALFRVLDQKLSSFLLAPGVEPGEIENQVVQRTAKALNDIADSQAHFREWIWDRVLDSIEVHLQGNDIALAFPERVYARLEIRQVFAGPV